MKRILICVLISYFAFSCKSSDVQGFSNVTYKSNFQTASSEKPFEKRVYRMSIPKGYNLDKDDYNPEYKEIVYNYDDSSRIYITDNALGGSSLNGDNKMAQGINSIKRKSLNDSLYMKGMQKDGKYWKENILNDIVIGYLNVPKERKADFDKAIASLVRK